MSIEPFMVDHGKIVIRLLGDIGEIGFHCPIQQHLCIGQWLVVDQPVQLAAPSHGRAILVFYGCTINDQRTSIIKQQINIGGIEINTHEINFKCVPPPVFRW